MDIILKCIELKYLQESYESSDDSANAMIKLMKESLNALCEFNVSDFIKAVKEATTNKSTSEATSNVNEQKEKIKNQAEKFIKEYLVFFKNYAPTIKISNETKITNGINKTIELKVPYFFKKDELSLFDFIETTNFISSEDEVYSIITLKFTIQFNEITDTGMVLYAGWSK